MKKVLLLLLIVIAMVMIVIEKTEALDLQKWFEKEAMKLNEKKIMYDPHLNPYDQMTKKQCYDRVYWLDYYAKELNYIFTGIHPRRVWKDTFAIVAVESWFVNWQSVDGGKGFGWGCLLWSTCKYTAERLSWDWKADRRDIARSDKLQAKYIVGYYYLMLLHYQGDRHRAITGYNKGTGVKDEIRWENYFFLVYGKLKYYEELWAQINRKAVIA